MSLSVDAADMTSGPVRVYAITDSRRVPAIRGMRAVRVGRLAALITDGRRALAPTPTSLRRYHRTIAAIAAELPAALPVRYGTAMTEAELMMALGLRAASLTETLRRVRGRVQMTVRVLAADPPNRAPALPARPSETGRAYLRRRAATVRHIPGFDEVRTALRRWIEDERVERHGDVISVYHLVPRRAAVAYVRTAEGALARSTLRGVVSGPFPPYAFSAW